MFKIINKYQTGDGREHDTEKKAAEHVESLICAAFDNAIKNTEAAQRGEIKAKHILAAVLELYSQREKIRQALDLELFGDDGRDDETEND